MRRPLKPFVTEYKGARRPLQSQPPNFGPQQTTDPQAANDQSSVSRGAREPTSFDGEWSRIKSFDGGAKPDPDDAYEAAMRAADALFTRSDGAPSHRGPSPTAPATQDEPQGSAIPPERGGRILRAIDEPPPPQFAALEAAYAPKRRGRKPGSKNKPKIAVALQSETPVVPSPREVSPEVPQTAAAETTPAPSIPAVRQVEAIAVAPDAVRGERRGVWQRDRLKPGEGWKRRRLPRVCW